MAANGRYVRNVHDGADGRVSHRQFQRRAGSSDRTTDPFGNPTTTLTNTIYDPLTDQTVNGKIAPVHRSRAIYIPSSRIDPVAAKIQALIPAPTNSALINNFDIVDSHTTDKNVPSIKIDENVGSKTKFSFYWSEWRQNVNKRTLDGLPWPVSPARIYIDRRRPTG